MIKILMAGRDKEALAELDKYLNAKQEVVFKKAADCNRKVWHTERKTEVSIGEILEERMPGNFIEVLDKYELIKNLDDDQD